MLVRLGLDTATHHSAADEDRLALLDVKTIDRYRTFLLRIHGFESFVEEALWRMPDIDRELLAPRLKADALRADLAVLGSSSDDIAKLPRCRNLNLRSVPHAMGWLFVIERHTLVAGVIARQVTRRLGDLVRGATSYLDASATEPGRRFRLLGDALGEYARQYTTSAIIAGANEGFRAQRQWYAVDCLRTTEIVRTPAYEHARSRRAG